MGVDVVGYVPPSVVMYGAYAAPGATVATSATSDSAASMSIATTSTNTKWLIEIDADVSWVQGTGGVPVGTMVAAKVDGAYTNCSGGLTMGGISNAGFEQTEDTIRGRCVVTLATVAAHTILAALVNGGGGSVTFKAVTITATQLTG
jgi:hypothetical protein